MEMPMRLNSFAATVAVLTIAFAASEASAQTRNSAPASSPYKFCLEETTGGAGGGPLPMLCRFTSLQQCMQSRMNPTDRCVPNTTGQRS